MRVVFMGTPQIAADCLSRLIADGFDLVGVYTKPDMPKNRGMKLAMSEVKEVALAAGLPVYQPATFRDDAAVEELRALRPDVIAVVAYGKILPQRVLDIPKLGCINIHTSILPALRGSAPAQWAILNGLDETGVTAMYLSAGMDEGDIIEIRKTPIEPLENSTALLARLETVDFRADPEELVARCVAQKRDLVEQDEFDTGARQLLNLGHTLGHGVEACSGYTVSHGRAVAIGMTLVTRAAVAFGRCPAEVLPRLRRLLERYGLPDATAYSAQALYEKTLSDKKRSGDTISLVVPIAWGASQLVRIPVSELPAWIERGLGL